MNGTKLFLDTNIIIYLLNGDDTLATFLDNKILYISVITELELLSYHKITQNEKEILSDFISNCKVVNINTEIKKEVINLRHKFKTKLPDSIIMASSIFLNIPIITADLGFEKAKEVLKLILYEK